MTRDLFSGGTGRERSYRGPTPLAADDSALRVKVRSRPQHYFTHDQRTYSYDELVARSGWKDAAEKYPESNLIIVLHTMTSRNHFLCLIAVPRGRDSTAPARVPPPFWGHGDVMHIDRVRVPP